MLFVNGATSFSKFVPESPITQTVKGPFESGRLVAAFAPELTPAAKTIIMTGTIAFFNILNIDIPFLDALDMGV